MQAHLTLEMTAKVPVASPLCIDCIPKFQESDKYGRMHPKPPTSAT